MLKNITTALSFALGFYLSFSPTLSFASEEFLDMINHGRHWDPYNPKVRKSGHFVGLLQLGTNADNSLFDSESLHLGYYHNKDLQLFVQVPALESDWLGLGAEYKVTNSDWLGITFQPEPSDFTLHYRGISEFSKTEKAYYGLSGRIIDGGSVLQVQLGYYSRPFISSKNSFIDTRAAYQTLNSEAIDVDTIDLFGQVGHGWANFADKKGLELYGSIGLEYTLRKVSTEDDSTTDLDPKIIIGILYHQAKK